MDCFRDVIGLLEKPIGLSVADFRRCNKSLLKVGLFVSGHLSVMILLILLLLQCMESSQQQLAFISVD